MKKIFLLAILSLCLVCSFFGCKPKAKAPKTEYYNATISVLEKETGAGIKDATVKCNDKEYKTDANGQVTINDLDGEKNVSVTAANYIFDKLEEKVSAQNKTVIFTGEISYKLSGVAKSGDIFLKGVKIISDSEKYKREVLTDDNGKFEIPAGGSTTLKAEYSGVTFEENTTEYTKDTENKNDILFDGIYEKVVVVKSGDLAVEGVTVKVEDSKGSREKITGTNGRVTFAGLSGTLKVTAEHTGYNSTEMFTWSNIKEDISINKTYNIEGRVTGIDIENINISCGSLTKQTNDSGYFKFENISGKVSVSISKENYTYTCLDNKNQNITKYTDIDFIVESFLVKGIVKTGSLAVDGVEISSDQQFGNNQILTDNNGSFSIWLTESCELAADKAGYSFKSKTIEKSITNLDIEGTYSIGGSVYDLDGSSNRIPLEDVSITIIDELSEQTFTTLMDGLFSFDGITGIVRVSAYREDKSFRNSVDREYSAPNNQIIFSTTSYEIKGKILSGILPVANARVLSSSGVEALTNSLGEYHFPALEGENILTVIKDGYYFEINNININLDDEGTDIDFSGTFTVKGYVRTGSVAVGGVEIRIGGVIKATTDSNGYYEISGLASEVNLSLNKTGYNFTGNSNFTGANLNANFDSTYAITIKVTFKGAGQTGVSIIANGNEIGITGPDGSYIYNNARGPVNLIFEKNGYAFSAISATSTPGTFTSTASFVVYIEINNINNPNENIDIKYDGKNAEFKDGLYKIVSDKDVDVTFVSADNKYTVVNPAYDLPLRLTDYQDTINFYAFINYTVSGNVNTYTLSDADTKTYKDQTADLKITNTYSINGTSYTLNQTISKTGNYSINCFGTTTIIPDNYLYNNSLDKSKLFLIDKAKTLNSVATGINFTLLNEKEFALHVFNEAKQIAQDKTKGTRYVTIEGTANVQVPLLGLRVQNIFGFKTRDASGNIKNLAGNYGANILTADPKTAFLTIMDTNNSISYFLNRKTDSNFNVTESSGMSPAADNKKTGISKSDYYSYINYYPDDITPYVIDNLTVKNDVGVAFNLTEKRWTIDFNFNVGTGTENTNAVRNYNTQIKKFSGQTLGSWTSASTKINLTESYYIKTISNREVYTVMGATTTATPTETYHEALPANLKNLHNIPITDSNGNIILDLKTVDGK